jgi:nitroreductase
VGGVHSAFAGARESERVADESEAVGLHPLLATRWSPVVFESTHEATVNEVEALLEAARWAPSAGNSQPWAFIVGFRGDAVHSQLIGHLTGSSARWAPTASLLVANLAHRFVADTDEEVEYSEFALYDLGQAVAHMTVQARAMGWQARQFRAFDRDGIATEFAVPPHWEVTSMSAFGVAPDPAEGRESPAEPSERREASRERRLTRDLLWPPA